MHRTFGYTECNQLRDAAVCRLTLFNVGRGGEYIDNNGQQNELLSYSVSDKSAPMLAILSGQKKPSKIVKGKPLLERNFISKGRTISISSKTFIKARPNLETQFVNKLLTIVKSKNVISIYF